MWIEIDREDVKVGDTISHNEHAEYKVTQIEDGLIHTTPGSFFYVERDMGFDGPLFRLVEVPKELEEFEVAVTRRVEPHEYGDYEFKSPGGLSWEGLWAKSGGSYFLENLTYRKVATPAPEEEAPTFESQVDAVLKEVKTLLLEKNLKYGNSALEPVRIFSKADPSEQIRVRLDDKLSRIRNGADTEDPIKDLQGYLVLLKIKEGGK